MAKTLVSMIRLTPLLPLPPVLHTPSIVRSYGDASVEMGASYAGGLGNDAGRWTVLGGGKGACYLLLQTKISHT